MKTVVTAGEIVVEIMAQRRGQTFDEPGPLFGPFPSGAPAIFIDQVARLGQPAAMIASVGDDDFGRLNIARLAGSGVDVSAIRVHAGEATGSAFVRYAADGSRDFVFNIARSAARLIELTEAARRVLDRADHFHVMGSSLFSPEVVALVLEGIRLVKARGGSVSFDPNIRKEMLDLPGMRPALATIIGQADVFLPSGEELYLFTDSRTEADAASEILARGAAVVVVKKGAEGASLYDAAGRTDRSAFAVEEVDPTGAGDCFGGAFVTSWLRGATPAEALRLAAAAGACAVSRQGPMAGTATAAELETFLARHRDAEPRAATTATGGAQGIGAAVAAVGEKTRAGPIE